MNLRSLFVTFTLLAMAIPSHAQLTINIRYTGENGAARGYVKEMEESGIRCYVTSLTQSEDYTKVSYKGATAVVIGNEAHGVSQAVLDACREHIKIPMDGSIESLNAAIACAVVLFEATRQRR